MRENPLVRAPAEVKVSICSRCKAYLRGNQWREPSTPAAALKDAAREATLSELRFTQFTPTGVKLARSEEVDELELQLEPRSLAGEIFIDVRAQGRVHELQVRPHVETARVKVKPNWTTCNVCRLKSAGHHEAILQVRGEGRISAGALKLVKGELEKCAAEARKRDRAAFIAKIEERAGGLDLYVNPLSLARRMASRLKAEFGAKIIETAKLIGRDRSGRRKLKVSVLARLPARK
jgi:nonsense-mediated mRNA decay protein 3